jgi:hypothetical protein
VLQEGQYASESIVRRVTGRSRETVTVLSGQNLQAGGPRQDHRERQIPRCSPCDRRSEAAAGIYDAVDASAADAEGAVVRLAEVNAAELVWPAGITAPQQTTALGQLRALTIIAR